MGIKAKVKNWWNGLTFEEKVVAVLGATATVCSLYVTADCVYQMRKVGRDVVDKVDKDVSAMKIELRVVPGKEENVVVNDGTKKSFSESPILGGSIESRSQFEMATALYNMMDPYNDDLQKENGKDIITDEMRQTCLELAWDLAAREGKVEKAEEEGLLPTQVWD